MQRDNLRQRLRTTTVNKGYKAGFKNDTIDNFTFNNRESTVRTINNKPRPADIVQTSNEC